MGVLGLTPFIQKTCPEVIKRLPNRLQGFSGKKIVLDGTLLTQRFHFAQIPHPYRHVLGWYRLIKELQESGVEAICVFDGKERNLAKAQEALRRKNIQRLTAARASIENERLTRLNQISKAVSNISKLSFTEKAQVTSVLNQLTSKDSLETKNKDGLCFGQHPADDISWVNSESWSTENDSQLDEWYLDASLPGYTTFSDAEEALREESSVTGTLSLPLPEESENLGSPPPGWVGDSDVDVYAPEGSQTRLQSAWSSEHPSPPTESVVNQVLSTLVSLYREYKNSIPKVASIPLNAARISSTMALTHSEPHAGTPAIDPTEADAVQEAYEMSKRQHQLSLQEGKFWNNLTSTLDLHGRVPEGPVNDEDGGAEGQQSMLRELTHKSNLISESYRTRLQSPTGHTYAQCKEILQAMGVSCVDCDGPFEAEALASSLVLNGHADYVASEDTDVLVFEAPLIRNITTRQQPLLLISGAELRSMLNLTRPMFIDFILLMGTDFSQRIRNVGPARALDFIRTHGSIEKVIEAETKFQPRVSREDYMRQVNMGRNVFRTLPPVPEDAIFRFGSGGQQKSNLGQVLFVMGKYGLSREVDWDSEGALGVNYFDDDPQW